MRLRGQLPEMNLHRTNVQRTSQALMAGQRRWLEQRRVRLEGLGAQLRALSPEQTLTRGYAIVRTQTGTIVRSGHGLSKGQPLNLRLASGAVDVSVERIQTDLIDDSDL